jgi:hypothetical protein
VKYFLTRKVKFELTKLLKDRRCRLQTHNNGDILLLREAVKDYEDDIKCLKNLLTIKEKK